MMIARRAEPKLRELLQKFPAVALLGPRQVGKTTLARSLADRLREKAIYLDLELPSDRAKLSDPELYLSEHQDQLVVLDEIHRLPGIFQVLRGLIDRQRHRGKRSGQFLLLGSASVAMLQQSSESLAGRIAYLELTPFLISEVNQRNAPATENLWVRGGFPDSFLADSDSASLDWRNAFIQTYLERDVPSLGPRIPAETLRRFWQMLAHNQGQLWNAAPFASGLGVSGHTVARYLDVLADLLLVRRLQPWASNVKKRLVRSPKVYVRDSGTVHALLGIQGREGLLGHPVVGSSWEGFLIENIVGSLPGNAHTWFYRTSAGAEIDLVLEFGSRNIWAIEIKRSVGNPLPSKGFHIGCEDLHAKRKIVLYAGNERYRSDSGTEIMPPTELLAELERR